MTNAMKLIIKARESVGRSVENEASARFCLREAIEAYDRDDFDAAEGWAKRSLKYSRGVGYVEACA